MKNAKIYEKKPELDQPPEVVDFGTIGRNRDRDRERDRECDNCGPSHGRDQSTLSTEDFEL